MDVSEKELITIFSKQQGYKRLCFRVKQNGPMCFVEFEDVSLATKALCELFGHPLSNNANGGLRLSFSKNPLGVLTTHAPDQTKSIFRGSHLSVVYHAALGRQSQDTVSSARRTHGEAPESSNSSGGGLNLVSAVAYLEENENASSIQSGLMNELDHGAMAQFADGERATLQTPTSFEENMSTRTNTLTSTADDDTDWGDDEMARSLKDLHFPEFSGFAGDDLGSNKQATENLTKPILAPLKEHLVDSLMKEFWAIFNQEVENPQ
jgi:hypothetical protein